MQLNAFSGQTESQREEARRRAKARRLDDVMKSGDVSMADICMIALYSTLTPNDIAQLANRNGMNAAELMQTIDSRLSDLKQRALEQMFDFWLNPSD